MKNVRLPLLAALALVLAWSCSAPLSMSGDASLTLALGGVLPPASGIPGSRAFIPGATTDIRVMATDAEAAVAYDRTFPAAGASLFVPGLPSGIELTLRIEALGSGGVIISSWQSPSRVVLDIGPNAVNATLVPLVEPMTFSVSGIPSSSALFDLPATGDVQFVDVNSSDPEGTVRQILVDSGSAHWAWMGVYDDAWKPYPVLCSDPAAGWAVVAWPASGTLRVAVANTVSSSGYPAGPLNGAKVQVRPAALVTSVPEFNAVLNIDGQTIVMREGVYEFPDTVAIGENVRIYGGFDPGWKTRTGTTELRLADASLSTITLQVTGGFAGGLLDRLSITGRQLDASVFNATALYLTAIQPMIVNGCTITGCSNAAMVATQTMSAVGLRVGAGTPEIVGCTIRGGFVGNSGTFGASSKAVSVEPMAGMPVAYLHDCTLDGGTASSVSEGAGSTGLACTGADVKAVVVGCRIWGGRATAGSGYSAMSAGVSVSTSAIAWVVSCSINGGRADGFQAASRGVYLNDTANIVAACTIDAGYATGSDGHSAECVYIQNDTTRAGILSLCLFHNSTPAIPAPDRRVAVTESNVSSLLGLQQLNGNGVIGCAPLFKAIEYADLMSSAAILKNYNQYAPTRTPALEFMNVGTAADFPAFMAMDLRPRTDALIALDSLPLLALPDWGLDTETGTYPALLLDLAGRPRPAWPAPWKRGAYNP